VTVEPGIEHTFPSTTFVWRKVKMKPPPAGHNSARAKRGRWRHLARWPRARSLTITVSYRGGAESWWLVKARGSQGVFPGHAQLEDVMAAVFSEPDYAADRERSEDYLPARRTRDCPTGN
jgi:hypothetical protein